MILALTAGSVLAGPLAAERDVDVLAAYCHCAEAASMALRPADRGEEVDMAVVNARRYRADRAARAAAEAVKNVDLDTLKARRDQAYAAAAQAVAAADQGLEVDMAVVHALRYRAQRLRDAMLGAELALARVHGA
jgi:hypothetical protein